MSGIEEAIIKNRKREYRFNKAERLLHRLRQHIFDYADKGIMKEEQASRLIARCKKRLEPRWHAQHIAAENARHSYLNLG